MLHKLTNVNCGELCTSNARRCSFACIRSASYQSISALAPPCSCCWRPRCSKHVHTHPHPPKKNTVEGRLYLLNPRAEGARISKPWLPAYNNPGTSTKDRILLRARPLTTPVTKCFGNSLSISRTCYYERGVRENWSADGEQV